MLMNPYKSYDPIMEVIKIYTTENERMSPEGAFFQRKDFSSQAPSLVDREFMSLSHYLQGFVNPR